MRAKKEYCYPCLENLVRKTSELAAGENETISALEEKGLFYLAKIFSEDSIPTVMAGEIQRVIRKEANCRDPFSSVKQKEMKLAGQLSAELHPPSSAHITDFIKFAVKGNSIDFFVPFHELQNELKKAVYFARDDTDWLLETLAQMEQENGTKKILYLADNAGECYFDLPLAERLMRYGDVYYVLKEAPVQNDLTPADLEKSGIRKSFGHVVTSGTDTPGLDTGLASADFLALLNEADLIIAKGMGHYETLPEMELPAPSFLLMKAKCRPIAASLGIGLNDYTAMRLGDG